MPSVPCTREPFEAGALTAAGSAAYLLVSLPAGAPVPAFAGYESVRKLVVHGPTAHVGIGICGAVLGIAGNLAVARYKLVVGRRIKSTTLVADARHSWLDALSSAGALAGLLAVAAGQQWGDPVAGMAVRCSSAMSATT